MAFDAHKNLAVSTVAVAPTPATSGTSLVVTAGEGVRFPAPPFNVTIYPANAPATPANAEIARVTARATDTLTLVRAQEGSTARAVGVGDLIAQTITAKTLTDLETQAALKDAANVFTQPQTIASPGSARVNLKQTDGPADSRWFDILNGGQNLYMRALNDAETVVQGTPLQLSRTGDVYIGRNLYEKARATPLGHWTVADCASYTQTPGFTGPYHWTLIGKTLMVVMLASGTMAGGPSYVFNLPAGCTAAIGSAAAIVALYPGASWTVANAQFTAGGTVITVYRDGLTAFPAGGTYIQASLFIPIL